MVIDHIAIVVQSLEIAIQRWQDLFGYHKNSDIVTNSRQGVKVVFLARKDSITVKLLEPSDATSPVAAFARKGGGLHHICFRCDVLKDGLATLKSKGVRVLVPPQPGEAFCNEDIAFLFADNNLNIELIDTDKKAGWRG